MTNEWVLDVLADLRTFAQQNGLSALAGQLDMCWQVGAVEMASTSEEQALYERGTSPEIGHNLGLVRESSGA